MQGPSVSFWRKIFQLFEPQLNAKMSLQKAKELLDKYIRTLFAIVIGIVILLCILEPWTNIRIPVEFYFSLILVLLLAIVDQLISLKPPEHPLRIFPSQIEAMTEITSYILKHKGISKVDILVCSASTMEQALYALLDKQCHIRVLLADPRTIDDQRERNLIVGTYSSQKRYFGEAGKKDMIEFGFYDVPTSLRGINIDGNIIGVGWYTHSKDVIGGRPVTTIMGARNPFIVADGKSREGRVIQEFFRKKFDKLWKNKIEEDEVSSWWTALSQRQDGQEL